MYRRACSEVHRGQLLAETHEVTLRRSQLEEIAPPADDQPPWVIAVDVRRDLRRIVLAPVRHEILPRPMEPVGEPFIEPEPRRHEAPNHLERRAGKAQLEHIPHVE